MISCPKCSTAVTATGTHATCPKCGVSFETAPTGTILAPQPAGLPPAPPTLGKYEVIGTVAKGGMGVIYKGRQPELDRIVALKVISPQYSSQPSFIERFFQEARTLAKLNHPNIVQIYDAARDGAQVFIVMEFIDGQSLRAFLRQRRLTPDEALRLIPPICDALDYAHSQGIVHRDIKPENILLTPKGEVKITDFGLAFLRGPGSEGQRLTATDVVMGTLDYMAPEQRMGAKHVDHRADVYALGVMLYEMLTGKLPLGRFDPPSAMGLDRRFDPVIARALEQEPDQRYQHASEIKDRLTKISNAGMSNATAAPVSTTAPTRQVTTAAQPGQVLPPQSQIPGQFPTATMSAPPPTFPPPALPPKQGMSPILIVVLVIVGMIVLACGGCGVLGMIGSSDF